MCIKHLAQHPSPGSWWIPDKLYLFSIFLLASLASSPCFLFFLMQISTLSWKDGKERKAGPCLFSYVYPTIFPFAPFPFHFFPSLFRVMTRSCQSPLLQKLPKPLISKILRPSIKCDKNLKYHSTWKSFKIASLREVQGGLLRHGECSLSLDLSDSINSFWLCYTSKKRKF